MFKGCDLVLVFVGGFIFKCWVEEIIKVGVVMVDNFSVFCMVLEVFLVVLEINFEVV